METIRLKTLYVLFFIELGTCQVRIAGCTAHPDGKWVAQQARNLVWEMDDKEENKISFLIHDRDRKFCGEFNRVFESEGVEIVLTPPRAPQANSYAERWVRTAREECLDQILILNEKHLLRVMKDFSSYHNHERPHQGLDQRIPLGTGPPIKQGSIQRRDVLGGIIHSYYRQAA